QGCLQQPRTQMRASYASIGHEEDQDVMAVATTITSSGWLSTVPVRTHLVVLVAAVAIAQTISVRQLIDGAGRRGLQLLARERHYIGTLALVIVQRAPGNGMVFLGKPQKPAEAHHGEHDAAVLLVQHHVLELPTLVAGGVLHIGADYF